MQTYWAINRDEITFASCLKCCEEFTFLLTVAVSSCAYKMPNVSYRYLLKSAITETLTFFNSCFVTSARITSFNFPEHT